MVLQALAADNLNSLRVTAWLSDVKRAVEACPAHTSSCAIDASSTNALKRNLTSMEGAENAGSPELAQRPASPAKRRRIEDSSTSIPMTSPSVLSSNSGKLPQFSAASRARTRTPSPTKTGDRVRRVGLEFTKPSFFLGNPDHSHQSFSEADPDDLDAVTGPPLTHPTPPDSTPPVVAQLTRLLSEYTNTPSSIPTPVAPFLIELTQNLECIPPCALGDSRFPASISPQDILAHAKQIHAAAATNFRTHESETARYPIVRTVLAGPLPSTPASSSNRVTFFTVEESQTILVHSDLLPAARGCPIPSVKMDHLLQFNRAHRNVGEEALNKLFERDLGLWLSAFNDAVAGKTFTAGVVEVKAPSGDYEEGVYQFCVAASAVVQRLRVLRGVSEGGGLTTGESGKAPEEEEEEKEGEKDDDDEDMPVVGWVVHGHFWYLHIAYRRKDGNIRVIGPFPSGNTSTYLGIFRLVSIIRSFKKWAKEVYWPWLKNIAEKRWQAMERNRET